jgi:accessory colonization factor AcfD
MFMQWNPTATQFPQNPINDFLLWHEAGHNMVESWLAVEGAGEVANNVMALYQEKSFGQTLYTSQSLGMVGTILAKDIPWTDGGDFGKLIMYHQLVGWIDANYLDTFKAKNPKYYDSDRNVKSEYPFLKGDGFDIYKILHREARDRAESKDKYDVCMKQNGKTKVDMFAICTSAILERNTVSFFQAWKAGIAITGNVGGKNIIDRSQSITEGLDTGYSEPRSSIENYTGN